MINERIKKLRELMIKRNIDAYIIPSSDPHQSEYLASYYKTREYISGFSGSAGTAVVTLNKAGVWTDGRYFIQAEKELQTSEFELYKMGTEGYPTIIEFLEKEIPEYGKVAFDGNTISLFEYENYIKLLPKINFVTDVDYVGKIWNEEGRPKKPSSSVFVFDTKYSGENTADRISRLRKMMEEKNIDYHFIGSLDDICYVLNIRGRDVHCCPVVISYLLVSKNECVLFIDKNKLSDEVLEFLNSNNVKVENYDDIIKYIKEIPAKKTLYLEPRKTNVEVYSSINSSVNVVKGLNLTSIMKSIKNEIEIKNSKNAYVKDGIALVKFFNWVERGVKTGNITEMVASKKLLSFRQQNELFIEDSFETISAYGENAALPHYKPSDENPVTLESRGLYLVDSGAHYLDGTTDITRTVALGELTKDEIFHYTMVLKAHISLIESKFLKGTPGSYLDAFTRQVMWKNNIDFKHGTGHGVGHVLNVHEGPQRIATAGNEYPMEVGMVTSDEPGIYISGSHGIRIENIIVCVEDEKNEFGEFLKFDNLTIVPIDTRPVDKDLLTKEEIEWLNNYNKLCYDVLSPYLLGNDLEYLEEQCKAI